jgi:hypothetical protein
MGKGMGRKFSKLVIENRTNFNNFFAFFSTILKSAKNSAFFD